MQSTGGARFSNGLKTVYKDSYLSNVLQGDIPSYTNKTADIW